MNIGLDNAFAFVTVFGLLVFLHELGHFVVAKWCGIKVEVFSLGFGPRLLGWRSGETDYRVSLVPLGGYVKMLGEEAEMELVSDPRDEGSSSEEAATNAGSFATKPRWQRFLVMVAGALMNIILAILIVMGMNMVGHEEAVFMDEEPRIAGVEPDSPAAAAGFRRGDRVLAVEGKATPSWEILQQEILFNPGRTLAVTVERDGKQEHLSVGVTLPPEDTRQARYRIGYIGLSEAAYDVQIWRVEPDSAAARAGLLEGDLINVIEDEVILTREDVARIIELRPGLETRLHIRRSGESLDITAVPEEKDGKGLLGVHTGATLKLQKLSPWAALQDSVQQNLARTGLFFKVVGKLLTGGLSVRAVSGPVDIFIFSGEALRRGWLAYFDLMALFSLQLGILNLLPIPFLDGGHIAILGVEGVLRRDLSVRLKERLLQAGFVLLLLFMGVVLYSDIAKNLDLFTGWFS